jgi:hypothetical protein
VTQRKANGLILPVKLSTASEFAASEEEISRVHAKVADRGNAETAALTEYDQSVNK